MCRQVQLVNKSKDESNLLVPAVMLGIHNMSEFQNSELQRDKTSLYEIMQAPPDAVLPHGAD